MKFCYVLTVFNYDVSTYYSDSLYVLFSFIRNNCNSRDKFLIESKCLSQEIISSFGYTYLDIEMS